jgi:hypothetical protein
MIIGTLLAGEATAFPAGKVPGADLALRLLRRSAARQATADHTVGQKSWLAHAPGALHTIRRNHPENKFRLNQNYLRRGSRA